MFNKAPLMTAVTFFAATLFSITSTATVVPGSIPGEFAVSGGAASYSIPIAVAPGRGGMQPELSLNYNSNGGNGILGVGWSLGGLSAIHRCPQTYAQDGKVGGINFDSGDRYCMDGQRLIPIDGVDGGMNVEYRTEIDSYSKITSHGGSVNNPNYWMVKTKAGQVIRYGSGINDGRATQSFSQGNMSWSVREINDTTGSNFIRYSYEFNQNVQYLKTIGYVGGRVELFYQPRSDNKSGYMVGSYYRQAERLNQIAIGANGVATKDYILGYEYDDNFNQSNLTDIEVCDNASHCLKKSLFSKIYGSSLALVSHP